jgi:hypothetical protein
MICRQTWLRATVTPDEPNSFGCLQSRRQHLSKLDHGWGLAGHSPLAGIGLGKMGRISVFMCLLGKQKWNPSWEVNQ